MHRLLKNKLFKASIGYSAGNYLLKGLNFITLPIFARIMTIDDFGYYNMFLAYEGIIYLLISLGLHVSLKNAKYEFGDTNLCDYVASMSMLQTLFFIVLMSLCIVLYPLYYKSVGLELPLILLLFLFSWCNSILVLYQSDLILTFDFKKFLKLSYLNTLINIALSLFFIIYIFDESKYIGRVLGSVIGMAFVATIIIYQILQKSKKLFITKYWKYGLKIGLPIIPHGIGQIIILSFDKIMIANMLNVNLAGLYSFGYAIFAILQISVNSLTNVYEPWAFDMLNKKNFARLVFVSKDFLSLISLLGIIFMLISPELVYLLGGDKYITSINAVIPVICGGCFAMMYNVPSIIIYYYKRTSFLALGTVLISIFNLILNYVFLPKYGYTSAAYTTMLCYFMYLLINYRLSVKLANFKIIGIKHLILCIFAILIGMGLSLCLIKYMLYRSIILSLVISFSIYKFYTRREVYFG